MENEDYAVPVTISDIHQLMNEEKIALGNHVFTTVLTAELVKNALAHENTIIHTVVDPEDKSKEIEVLTYVPAQGNRKKIVIENGMMYAVGILRTVNNSHGILSFNVHEIINQLEYQAFTLEAKVAKLYFEKNVPFMLRTGSQQNLGPFTPSMDLKSALQASAMSLLANHSQQLDGIRCMSFAQPYDTNSPSTSGARTLNDQCREVIDLLNWKRHCYGTLGLSAVQIAKALETADLDVVQDNLLFLIREGRIYNTCNRNHYALAKE